MRESVRLASKAAHVMSTLNWDIWGNITGGFICKYYHILMVFFLLCNLITSGTLIINIQVRLQPFLPAHLPVSGVPGILSPCVYHLRTLGPLCPPPIRSWASTCGRREDAPDTQTRSLGRQGHKGPEQHDYDHQLSTEDVSEPLLKVPPGLWSPTCPHFTGIGRA